ncbi:MAG: MarR family transcriptional regulator [Propionibacterium sp.]|nr:MarR family transcriptional regulator [Propionibacterium sp.]
MDTQKLLDRGETLHAEFKRNLGDRELYETVVCLANGEGGVLLVGVDNDGSVVGAPPRHGDHTDPHRVAAAIQNNTDPSLPVEVRMEQFANGEVLRIDVPMADPGPVGTKKGLYVKRVLGADGKPACVPITPQELVSRAIITRGIDPGSAPVAGADWDALDAKEFDRFRRLCALSGGDRHMANMADNDICRALGLIPRSHPVSLGMILLFGTPEALRRWVPTAEVLFQDSRDSSATNQELRLPLLQLAEHVQELLAVREATTEVIIGAHRVDIPLISSSTRREAVANALVHRDYSVLGPIVIRLSENEFGITSPGGFPPGVTIANILEQSRPRSIALADAFKRAGMVERRGKGVNEMFESQLRAGRDMPSYALSSADSVALSVPLSTTDLDLVRFLAAIQTERQHDLSLEQLRVVHEVKASGALTSSELAEFLSMTPATSRSVSRTLVEQGILEVRGQGRNRRFHLTARFYDLAKDRAAYVRLKQIDPLQQEQMVLDYVATYGQITRSIAMDLCQIGVSDARRLLKSLTAQGKLELRGIRRGAHYVLPSR